MLLAHDILSFVSPIAAQQAVYLKFLPSFRLVIVPRCNELKPRTIKISSLLIKKINNSENRKIQKIQNTRKKNNKGKGSKEKKN